jgi:hypothetical protein
VFLSLSSVLLALPAQPAMVKKMDLAEMCELAGRIFRGTVIDIDKGTVSAGGGDVPTIRYQLRVTAQFKGSFPAAADGEPIIAVTSVDLEVIDMPRLAVGQDYLLLTTLPSSVGLSTMVGLGQGTFRVYGEADAELAVNALNNAGLTDGMRAGPESYEALANRIRSILRRGPER